MQRTRPSITYSCLILAIFYFSKSYGFLHDIRFAETRIQGNDELTCNAIKLSRTSDDKMNAFLDPNLRTHRNFPKTDRRLSNIGFDRLEDRGESRRFISSSNGRERTAISRVESYPQTTVSRISQENLRQRDSQRLVLERHGSQRIIASITSRRELERHSQERNEVAPRNIQISSTHNSNQLPNRFARNQRASNFEITDRRTSRNIRDNLNTDRRELNEHRVHVPNEARRFLSLTTRDTTTSQNLREREISGSINIRKETRGFERDVVRVKRLDRLSTDVNNNEVKVQTSAAKITNPQFIKEKITRVSTDERQVLTKLHREGRKLNLQETSRRSLAKTLSTKEDTRKTEIQQLRERTGENHRSFVGISKAPIANREDRRINTQRLNERSEENQRSTTLNSQNFNREPLETRRIEDNRRFRSERIRNSVRKDHRNSETRQEIRDTIKDDRRLNSQRLNERRDENLQPDRALDSHRRLGDRREEDRISLLQRVRNSRDIERENLRSSKSEQLSERREETHLSTPDRALETKRFNNERQENRLSSPGRIGNSQIADIERREEISRFTPDRARVSQGSIREDRRLSEMRFTHKKEENRRLAYIEDYQTTEVRRNSDIRDDRREQRLSEIQRRTNGEEQGNRITNSRSLESQRLSERREENFQSTLSRARKHQNSIRDDREFSKIQRFNERREETSRSKPDRARLFQNSLGEDRQTLLTHRLAERREETIRLTSARACKSVEKLFAEKREENLPSLPQRMRNSRGIQREDRRQLTISEMRLGNVHNRDRNSQNVNRESLEIRVEDNRRFGSHRVRNSVRKDHRTSETRQEISDNMNEDRRLNTQQLNDRREENHLSSPNKIRNSRDIHREVRRSLKSEDLSERREENHRSSRVRALNSQNFFREDRRSLETRTLRLSDRREENRPSLPDRIRNSRSRDINGEDLRSVESEQQRERNGRSIIDDRREDLRIAERCNQEIQSKSDSSNVLDDRRYFNARYSRITLDPTRNLRENKEIKKGERLDGFERRRFLSRNVERNSLSNARNERREERGVGRVSRHSLGSLELAKSSRDDQDSRRSLRISKEHFEGAEYNRKMTRLIDDRERSSLGLVKQFDVKKGRLVELKSLGRRDVRDERIITQQSLVMDKDAYRLLSNKSSNGRINMEYRDVEDAGINCSRYFFNTLLLAFVIVQIFSKETKINCFQDLSKRFTAAIGKVF